MAQKLDEVYIDFKGRGLDSTLKLVNELDKKLSNILNINKGLISVGDKLTEKFQAQLDIAKQIQDVYKNIFKGSVKVPSRIIVEHKDASTTYATSGGGGGSSGNLLNSVKKLAGTVAISTKATREWIRGNNTDRKSLQQFYNSIMLSGNENARTVGAGINIARYGGNMADILSSDRAISTSLGALSRGDTGLIEHLGRYGIGGIMPNMSPETVRGIIQNKVNSGVLGVNEINSLFAGLPYSDAEKAAMLKGNPLYSSQYGKFAESAENQNVMQEYAKTQYEVNKALQNWLASDPIAKSDTKILQGIETFKKTWITLNKGTEILSKLAEIATAVLAFTGIKSLIGGGISRKGTIGTNGGTLGYIPHISAFAGGYMGGDYLWDLKWDKKNNKSIKDVIHEKTGLKGFYEDAYEAYLTNGVKGIGNYVANSLNRWAFRDVNLDYAKRMGWTENSLRKYQEEWNSYGAGDLALGLRPQDPRTQINNNGGNTTNNNTTYNINYGNGADPQFESISPSMIESVMTP